MLTDPIIINSANEVVLVMENISVNGIYMFWEDLVFLIGTDLSSLSVSNVTFTDINLDYLFSIE